MYFFLILIIYFISFLTYLQLFFSSYRSLIVTLYVFAPICLLSLDRGEVSAVCEYIDWEDRDM